MMEALNGLSQLADTRQVFSSLRAPSIRFRASFYTNDLVVFIAPTRHDIAAIKGNMETFARASGLRTNIQKCQFTLIGCTGEQIALVQHLLLCQLVQFLCKYLCIPLSVYQPKKADLEPLVDSVADRLPT
jgi:hypothetical protein